MSLIFGKVDRKNRLQSIYSDGIIVQGSEVLSTTKRKIVAFTSGDYTVSAGFCGLAYLGDYFRQHLQETFENTYDMAMPNIDFEATLHKMFNSLAEEYYREFGIGAKGDDRTSHFGGIVIINGTFYEIERYDGERFHCLKLEGVDSYAHGQGDISARCLMDNNVPPKKIIETIARYNTTVSNCLSAIEGISYTISD